MNHIYTTNIISEGDKFVWNRFFYDWDFQLWEHTREDGEKAWYIVSFDNDGRQRGWLEVDSDGYATPDCDGFPFGAGAEIAEPEFDFNEFEDICERFYGDVSFRELVGIEDEE